MSTESWTPEERKRFGEFAERARKSADPPISTNAILPSRETWLRVVRGDIVSGGTLRNLEKKLRWETLSADDFPGGTGPRPKIARSSMEDVPPEIEAAAYISETGRLIYGIAGNTPEEREQVLRLLRAGAQRLRLRDDNA